MMYQVRGVTPLGKAIKYRWLGEKDSEEKLG